MEDLKVCWNILPKVSRSFSLCITLLPKPVNDQMMLSYLIFRTIDTIEDSTIKIETKKRFFSKFLSVLNQERYSYKITNECKIELLKKLTFSYEADLLGNLDAVVRLYYSIQKNERLALLKQAKKMSRGMYKFQRRKIKTFDDQDEYAYYVAGVVGYIFNDLFYYNGIIKKKQKEHLMEYAKRYGLGLQKVNIIRDIANDIPTKRYYWPENLLKKYKLSYQTICLKKNRKQAVNVLNEMIRNAINYLNDGLYYIMSLPRTALKVRVFCLIPLFMAIESFIKCINNEDVFVKGRKVKISRRMVNSIVKKCYLYGCSNLLLKKWYNKRMRRAKAKYHKPKNTSISSLTP